MNRLALTALAEALLACAPASGGDRCPGTRLAILDFTGTIAGEPPPPEIPPEIPPTGCDGGTPPGGFTVPSPTIQFQATVATDPASTGAALCKPDKEATPLLGTRIGDVLDVTLVSSGAVLDQCPPACAVVITEEVRGTLVADSVTGALGFQGYLWDHAVAASASTDCGACVLPCDAVYLLTSTAAGSR